MPDSADQSMHAVQFYGDERRLEQTVSEFLSEGLTAGQPLLVIATSDRRKGLISRLHKTKRPSTLGALQKSGQLACLDAQETLARVMTDGMPDPQRFADTLTPIIDRLMQAQQSSQLRAYGEMVDLLWKDGNPAAAMRLEELWNDLSTKYSLSLLCACSIGHFCEESHAASFRRICEYHSHASSGDDRDMLPVSENVVILQRQALALRQEIAERERLEGALREALERSRRAEDDLRDFIDHAAEGLHWVGPDGIVQWANHAEMQLLGYSRDEYIGRHISEFHADPDVLANILDRLARKETLVDYPARLRCKDGSIKHVLISSNVRWDGDTFLHTRCFTRDVTDRKAGDDAARRLAAIVQSSDDAIVSKTLDSTIQSWNPAAERLFGYTAAEAIGKSIRIIIPADRQGEEDEVLRRIRAGQSIDHYETVRQRKDGSLVPISLTVSPIRDADGNVVGASKIARDISQRLELESLRTQLLQEERQARHEADRANRIKEEFLALLSHELRTPLNAILGWTQIASSAQHDIDPHAANRAMRRAIEVIERNAAAQARLVDDLLDISRVVSGKLELSTKPMDLAPLVESVGASAAPSAAAKRLTLQVRLLNRDVWITGDSTRLQQILWNLLSNAIKFTPADGIVEIELDRTEAEARISVRDTGQGIDPAFLPHVFDRFRQGDTSTTRRNGGLGIGLAVVKHLVEAHGGTAVAKSPGPGLGATFTITLPLVGKAAARAVAPAGETGSLTGTRILVVDDEADARELLMHLLKHRGADVTTAGSAGEAMRELSQAQYDLLLADLGMPVEDGFSLITAIRNDPTPAVRNIRAIAVTAYTSDHAQHKALDAGYDGYFRKPFEFERLVTYIIGQLQRSGVMQHVQEQRAEA